MSGPIDDQANLDAGPATLAQIEVREGRPAEVGGMGIVRVLPTKRRRMIGPWCFVDLMGPEDIAEPDPMEVGPHPHIGLATVTWLFEGEALHTDSLGSEQVIRPGQLNLMTAGHGIAHAELEVRRGSMHAVGAHVKGAQMWLAQPESTRHGESTFQHVAELPGVQVPNADVRLLMGSLADAASPASFEWPLIGAEVRLADRPATIPVDSTFEHGVIPVDRSIRVDDTVVEPGSLAIISPGPASLRLEATGPGRLLLIGGAPFESRVQMWWNFVARTRSELTQAWKDWHVGNDDRFAPVPSSLERIEAPTPFWVSE